MGRVLLDAFILVVFAMNHAVASDRPSPSGAKVDFVDLQDGETYPNPVRIVFGLSGMGVAPAGINRKHTGHHHLLIDRHPFGTGSNGEAELSKKLPTDAHHKDFCNGETEVVLDLVPGRHTLQLVLGDADHRPHNPPVVSRVISINTITYSKDEYSAPLERDVSKCNVK